MSANRIYCTIRFFMSSVLHNNWDAFDKWMNKINKNRAINCGKSIAEYPFASCRIRKICGTSKRCTGMYYKADWNERICCLLDESGSTRPRQKLLHVYNNWALLFAQRIGLKFSLPLDVCFSLPSSAAIQTRRHANFLLEGLTEVEQASLPLIIHSTFCSISNKCDM
ncbi:unnamed protein product [Rodentolepis nana]|uniref:Uncharacterized protein n=1 Tax=Rodentolepis nana TaxID=102285 RepID=A0A0R3T4U8_RODNA|nr:unnamed protein product [Rodentolepis nana]